MKVNPRIVYTVLWFLFGCVMGPTLILAISASDCRRESPKTVPIKIYRQGQGGDVFVMNQEYGAGFIGRLPRRIFPSVSPTDLRLEYVRQFVPIGSEELPIEYRLYWKGRLCRFDPVTSDFIDFAK